MPSCFFSELVILLLKVLQARNRQHAGTPAPVDPASMRPAVFLFLFGVDLSAAFVPLHMADLYQPLLGLPKDMVMGLPISAMFLSVSITIIVSGIWLDRRGWHEPFLTGVALVAAAKLYAWLAPSAVHFIAAMGMVGLGYGLTLMASQGFVIVQTDNKSKARGLAYLFAGIYAGSICGTAAGAMLAERIIPTRVPAQRHHCFSAPAVHSDRHARRYQAIQTRRDTAILPSAANPR
ncbi:MAG: MFS transporter [Gammaproteobacteria bacterium]